MEKIFLTTLMFKYKLDLNEVMRLYTFFSNDYYCNDDPPHNDYAINKNEAERFLLSAFNFGRCACCGQIKRDNHFYPDPDRWNNLSYECRECVESGSTPITKYKDLKPEKTPFTTEIKLPF